MKQNTDSRTDLAVRNELISKKQIATESFLNRDTFQNVNHNQHDFFRFDGFNSHNIQREASHNKQKYEEHQRDIEFQRSSNNSFKNDYDSLNDYQAVVNPADQIESIIQEMQNELFPKSNIPQVIHRDQEFQQAHASDLQNNMFFEQFVGNQEKFSNQEKIQGEQRYTLGPTNPTNFENSPENHAMSVDLFSEQKYLVKEKNESYSDQQIFMNLRQKQININNLSQLISCQIIDGFLEPLIKKIAREAFVHEQMALIENDDQILRSSQRQIYNSNYQISQTHNQSIQQSENSNYFSQSSNQVQQDNINPQNIKSNRQQSQFQLNQQINLNHSENQMSNFQKLPQNKFQSRQLNDLSNDDNLNKKIQIQQFKNNQMSINNNFDDDLDQEEDVNDEDDKILQVKHTQQQNIFQIQKNNDFMNSTDDFKQNNKGILFHQNNQFQQIQQTKIQNQINSQIQKINQATPQMQIIQDSNKYPISMTEQSTRKQNNFSQFDINNLNLNMTSFKPNNLKFDENNLQVDKFFQEEESTPFQNKEYLKMQASTERKALNVFERENSSNNQNLKWFDSIQQKLMSLGSPNIVQKDQNYINKPSQSDLLNQSNINSFNFRSLITGRGAEENNNFQIFGDQSIQLSTRGDEAIDVVCMNCGTYVQPQNVNIHSRECNQNQQLQSVSFFNKKRKQWLMIESNQKSLLKEMNEDISKIQEAIFSKLIKFDQKYETISLQIQTNSKKTYQVDNSFLSYKEFGNMIGDDNYFETSYNTSALVNQKQNFNVSEAQFQDQNLELIKKMSQISRLTIEKKESQIKNNQEDQKALILIKKLEYFIDQYSNLHAVCKQTLDINEDPMQLQIIMNVLVQDFKEMEETAVQQSLIKQQKDSINRSNQRQNISSVFQSPTHRLSNSEYKNIGSNSFIDQMIQNSNGYNQTSISYKTARKQDEIVYDQKHGQLLVFAKKLVQAIKEKLQALQNFENLLQEKYEMAQFQQNEEQESIYKEYTNRQTIQNEIQKMQIGQISLPNKQKVLLDAERNKISQLFDLETIHNNSEIKDSENSLQIDHLKSMSVRQSFQNSTPKNYVGQFMNSGYQYNQKSSKEDKYNNMRSSVVSKSVVNIQVQQPKEVVQKNIGEIEISVGPKLNIVQKSEKVDKIYQENLLNQIKSDQSSLINSKGNEKMKILTSEIDYPATSDFQKDIGYELFSVNVKQQNQEQNFDNKIQNQQNSQLSKASQQSPQKKNKKGGLSDFIENYVIDENEQMNIKFEKESDQNKISQKINAYEDHTFQNKQKSYNFLQNEIDKSPVDGRKSFKQFQLNKRQQNQINDSSYSERVAQLQQFQDQKIDLNFLKKQSQILKENQLQAQKQKIELNINRVSSDKQFENNNKNQKQLVNQQMSKSNFNDKQPIKLDQIFKDSNDSPNDSYKSSNEKQAQQIQFSFLNQNTKLLKKPTQFNKVNEIQQKSPQKSPLVQKQFLEKQERSNIFDRQKLKSPENFSTLQRQKSLQNSNLSQSKDQDKAVESQMIKKSYMPINTHEKLKAENEKLNKNKFESPDQKLNQNINQTTPQKFPKKSKKIDIETYGYDNDTIQNARKSVDRLMSATKNDQNAFQNRQIEQKFQQQNQMLQQFGLNIQGDRNQGQNEWNGIGQMNLATIQSVNETTEVSDIEQLNLMQESEAEHLIDNYKFNEKDIDTAKIESPPKSQRNNIFSKNRHRNCSKHSNSDNEQSESYRYTFEQRSDSVASQKKKSFLPQRTQSKEQNRKRTEQKQIIKQEEEKKQLFVSTEKPRKSRRINIEEFGYDGLTINRARNSVSSLSRQTILTNLSAQKDDKNNL